ncbi:cob(I)yrinic acid a,c-diamide adenosyltransferase [Patescibacteria group bacterium]|nr:cob(I)yrinic acid a,c-diamide adenosyltransferase [Patescibacteria group bacterium]
MAKGLVYVFTGNGKGKTSAALGVGMRAALSGMKVAMVCWYKEARWPISELGLPKKLKNFNIFLSGKGFYKLPTDHATGEEHKEAAMEALKKARVLLGKVDVLILDEVNNAVSDRLVKVGDVVDLLRKRGETHIVLTGRHAPKTFVRMADLVTEMKKIKHPFDKGKKAIKGLDY